MWEGSVLAGHLYTLTSVHVQHLWVWAADGSRALTSAGIRIPYFWGWAFNGTCWLGTSTTQDVSDR